MYLRFLVDKITNYSINKVGRYLLIHISKLQLPKNIQLTNEQIFETTNIGFGNYLQGEFLVCACDNLVIKKGMEKCVYKNLGQYRLSKCTGCSGTWYRSCFFRKMCITFFHFLIYMKYLEIS